MSNIKTELENFNEEYKDIEVIIKNNLELNDKQKKSILCDLNTIIESVNDGTFYRSSYKILTMLLKDIQFWEYESRKEDKNDKSE